MRLNNFFKSILLITIVQMFFFTNSSAQEVVAKFGKHEITLDEFEQAYTKNVGDRDSAANDELTEYKNFLDLYVKFKMKLRDAQVRAYDQDPALVNELKEYQKQVGVSYLIEKKINEPGIKQIYERRKDEYRVSHIMIRPDTLGEEGATNRAQTLLDSIKNGGSFEELAVKYSDDKFSGPFGGDIYYITAGLLPYEFEDPMYTLNPGEVYSEVVKTRFGNHLIKVTEKQHRFPKIKASHILISYNNDEGKPDTSSAKTLAETALAELNAGATFEELVQKYSDDTGTKDKGGDLGFFERRMMVKEFDEAAFDLQVGEVSGLVQTNFGFHIIKLADKMDTQPYESEIENLKEIFTKQRYQYERDLLITSLKEKYNFTLNENNFNLLVEESDSVRFGMVHPKLDEISNEVLFTYSNSTVTIGSFLEAANSNSKITAKPMDKAEDVKNAINLVSEEMLLNEEAMNLDKTDPQFAQLMNDYRDGIFIFKIQEEEVWDKVKIDSAAIYNYWLENKADYNWPERISFTEIFSTKDSLIKKYHAMLTTGAEFDTVAALYTERPSKKKDKGIYELQDVNTSEFSKAANNILNAGEYSQVVQMAGGFSIFKLNERQPAREKTFEEAKAEVSGEYQEIFSKKLEQDYLKSLETRYKPEIFYDKLEYAFAQGNTN